MGGDLSRQRHIIAQSSKVDSQHGVKCLSAQGDIFALRAPGRINSVVAPINLPSVDELLTDTNTPGSVTVG